MGGPAHAGRRSRERRGSRIATRARRVLVVPAASARGSTSARSGSCRRRSAAGCSCRATRASRATSRSSRSPRSTSTRCSKERFRQEPLTLGAAWHYGFWRSYFSHAAITHPANDGLREEFSTAWDIVRKHPAVLFRTAGGHDARRRSTSVRLDLPMIVGPLPHTDGIDAWSAPTSRRSPPPIPPRDLHTALAGGGRGRRATSRTRDVLAAARREHRAAARAAARARARRRRRDGCDAAARAARGVRASSSSSGAPTLARRASARGCARRTRSCSSRCFLRYGRERRVLGGARARGARRRRGDDPLPLGRREVLPADAARSTRSSRRALLRARVQLVSAGGDTDTQASAATVYESVLLGANGGAMTHLAGHRAAARADRRLPRRRCRRRCSRRSRDARSGGAARARDQHAHLLAAQHPRLPLVHGDRRHPEDLGQHHGDHHDRGLDPRGRRARDARVRRARTRELNQRRVAAEPVPPAVRERYQVSALLREVDARPAAGRTPRAILAHENANYHLENTNRNLNADFLEVIYRMAAGQLPRRDDFFIESDMGPLSLDGDRRSSCRAPRSSGRSSACARDPALLDYVSLAVPRGFMRPGAVAPRARVRCTSQRRADGGAAAGAFDGRRDAAASRCGSRAGHAVERGARGRRRSLWLRRRATPRAASSAIELLARGHGGHGLLGARASARRRRHAAARAARRLRARRASASASRSGTGR